jgi:glyoxylase-like metal-dependent hydrolase (beta-lactamase superfamily II)
MIDSPRFEKGLAEKIDDLGGIGHVLLSHRDDVAAADRWAERFAARVWIHEADRDAAPYATDLVRGTQPVTLMSGVQLIPIPGHTKGHLAFHVDDRWLFAGDTLHWNHRREELDVTADYTFYSWDALADSIELLAQLQVEWVFPGHGMWHSMPHEAYTEEMTKLAPAMRQVGQSAWSRRPGTAFEWL